MLEAIPKAYPVRPLEAGEQIPGRMECETCGRAWDDDLVTSMTPAPAGRCPFEAWHEPEPEPQREKGTYRLERETIYRLEVERLRRIENGEARATVTLGRLIDEAVRAAVAREWRG